MTAAKPKPAPEQTEPTGDFLHVVHPHDRFDSRIKGVDVIEKTSTFVHADLVEPVLQAARAANVTIEKG